MVLNLPLLMLCEETLLLTVITSKALPHFLLAVAHPIPVEVPRCRLSILCKSHPNMNQTIIVRPTFP